MEETSPKTKVAMEKNITRFTHEETSLVGFLLNQGYLRLTSVTRLVEKRTKNGECMSFVFWNSLLVWCRKFEETYSQGSEECSQVIFFISFRNGIYLVGVLAEGAGNLLMWESYQIAPTRRESADVGELPNSSHVSKLDDWKPVIMKLSNNEPEMLLSLLKTVVHMVETREALKCESGEDLKPEQNPVFEWLLRNLKDLKLLRRKLTSAEPVSVSSLGNNRLATAASVLAETTGNHTLVHKLDKLASLHAPNSEPINEISHVDPEISTTNKRTL
ncbi:las1-like family protein [Artemisia annua]|uniref:Las1-like family protein n=1 Tax=Artemisia annua TaxID=35608 RepID=A0A2U1L8X1_ARTAN|nr:las1-like family protein [Artemisia annua]